MLDFLFLWVPISVIFVSEVHCKEYYSQSVIHEINSIRKSVYGSDILTRNQITPIFDQNCGYNDKENWRKIEFFWKFMILRCHISNSPCFKWLIFGDVIPNYLVFELTPHITHVGIQNLKKTVQKIDFLLNPPILPCT